MVRSPWTGLAQSAALLCGSLCLAAPVCRAAVELDGDVLKVATPSLEMAFDGMNLRSLLNIITGEQNVFQMGPGWVDVSLQQPTGEGLQPGKWRIQADAATGQACGIISASDSVRTLTAVVGTDPATAEVFLRLTAGARRSGVRNAFFGLQGFDPKGGRFLLPARAGIYFDAYTDPPVLQMEYPTHWEAQFVVYETAGGGILIYARDSKPYYKRVNLTRQYGTLDLGLEVFALAPWGAATEVPTVEWRFKAFRGSWRGAVDAYRNWTESVWPKREPDSRREWTRRIRAVITVINPVREFLEPLAERLDPSKTLLYLVNWRRDPYDVNYPDYTPGPNTAAFIERAHELGFHVMLHTSALGVATYHAAYADLAPYQFRAPDNGELVYWPQGLWPAGAPPPSFIEGFAFISPCASAYRTRFLEAVRPMIETLRPDAVHLDAGGVMINDGNGLIEGMTSIEGMLRLHQEFAAAYPGVALSYESMTEVLASYHDFAQRWVADFPAHPIATYLMGDRVNFYGFLDQPTPDEPAFIDYLRTYEPQGIMPTIRVNSLDDFSPLAPITSRVFALMSAFQQHDFRPDWESDWAGFLFRYRGADGRAEAGVEDGRDVVRMKVAGQLLYERARHTGALRTPAFIRNWTAYDDADLYGLDPGREYWLETGMARPADAIHLSEVPAAASIGTGTLVAPGYGYFELQSPAPPVYDFLQAFREATAGVDYLKQDYRMGGGALVQVTRTPIAGEVRGPVILMLPPSRPRGSAVFLDYQVHVPEVAPVLRFSVGISDWSKASDGVWCLVRINGVDAWKLALPPRRLVPAEVDLKAWAGQTVHIRFIVHPGPRLSTAQDFACWTGLTLRAGETTVPAVFRLSTPETGPPPALSGTARLLDSPERPYLVETALPAKFSVFLQAPPALESGASLLSLPFEIWNVGYGGWPVPMGSGSRDRLQPATSGGWTEPDALPAFPPREGLRLVTWAVRLPESASRLEFKICLADPLPPLPPILDYSDTGFSIAINGEKIWDATLHANGWTAHTVDISKWAGRMVVVQLAVDALGEGTFNWANWAGLTIH